MTNASLASTRHGIGIGRVEPTGNNRRWAVIRTVATARTRMIVHPVGHKAITIDPRKQVLRRAIVTAAATSAQ